MHAPPPPSYVQDNFTPYDGDASFLAAPTEKTQVLLKKVDDLCHEELEKVCGSAPRGGGLNLHARRASLDMRWRVAAGGRWGRGRNGRSSAHFAPSGRGLLQGGVLDVDPATSSSITAFGPGYIDK